MLTYELLQDAVDAHNKTWLSMVKTPPSIHVIESILEDQDEGETYLSFNHIKTLLTFFSSNSVKFDIFPKLAQKISESASIEEYQQFLSLLAKYPILISNPSTYVTSRLNSSMMKDLTACIEILDKADLMEFATPVLQYMDASSMILNVLKKISVPEPGEGKVRIIGGERTVQQLLTMVASSNLKNRYDALIHTLQFIQSKTLGENSVIAVFNGIEHIESIKKATEYEFSAKYFMKLIFSPVHAADVAIAYQHVHKRIEDTYIHNDDVFNYPEHAIAVAKAKIASEQWSKGIASLRYTRFPFTPAIYTSWVFKHPAISDKIALAITTIFKVMYSMSSSEYERHMSILTIDLCHALDVALCIEAFNNSKNWPGLLSIEYFEDVLEGASFVDETVVDAKTVGLLSGIDSELSYFILGKIYSGEFRNSKVEKDLVKAEQYFQHIKDVHSNFYLESRKSLLEVMYKQGTLSPTVHELGSEDEVRLRVFSVTAEYVDDHGGSTFLTNLKALDYCHGESFTGQSHLLAYRNFMIKPDPDSNKRSVAMQTPSYW